MGWGIYEGIQNKTSAINVVVFKPCVRTLLTMPNNTFYTQGKNFKGKYACSNEIQEFLYIF